MTPQTLYRLADSTAVETLVNHWVAWPHTFSPAVYCLHLLNYQKKTLQSYLKQPEQHIKSSNNPKLLGGAFMNIPIERLADINLMLHGLETNQADDLEFAKALVDFQNLLDQEANGHSMQSYYQTLPESLRGYVELLYDYHNKPIVRCIENLLYHSKHYRKELQSLYLFTQSHDRMRSYYMSTPRLSTEDSLSWRIPFSSTKIDELFKLDFNPQPLSYIKELLELDAADSAKLISLLTDKPLPTPSKWSGTGIKIRYYGHACILIETADIAILIDPFISVKPAQGGIDRFVFQDLPEKIDFVLITHGHHDHFVFESLLRLRHKIDCLVVPKSSGIFYGDFSLRLMALELGFTHILEIEPLDSISIASGEIIGVPFLGEHNDLPFAKSAYMLKILGKRLLFAADSNCLDKLMYENLSTKYGDVDAVFLGMEYIGAPLSWVYGPLLPILPDYKCCQSRRSNGSNAEVAMNLLEAVNCQQVYIYAIGREPWLQYFMALEPSENDDYMQEIEKLLVSCQNKNFKAAKCLYGKEEWLLC